MNDEETRRLCTNCEYLRSKNVGLVSTVYWCGKVGNFYEKTSIGVYPWKRKPHPKCPLKDGKRVRGGKGKDD